MDILDLLKLANSPGIQSLPLLAIAAATYALRKELIRNREDQVRGFKDSAAQHQLLAAEVRAVDGKVESAVHSLGGDLKLLRQEVEHINRTTERQEDRLRELELGCAARHGPGGSS